LKTVPIILFHFSRKKENRPFFCVLIQEVLAIFFAWKWHCHESRSSFIYIITSVIFLSLISSMNCWWRWFPCFPFVVGTRCFPIYFSTLWSIWLLRLVYSFTLPNEMYFNNKTTMIFQFLFKMKFFKRCRLYAHLSSASFLKIFSDSIN